MKEEDKIKDGNIGEYMRISSQKWKISGKTNQVREGKTSNSEESAGRNLAKELV